MSDTAFLLEKQLKAAEKKITDLETENQVLRTAKKRLSDVLKYLLTTSTDRPVDDD